MELYQVAQIKLSYIQSAPGYHPQVLAAESAFRVIEKSMQENMPDLFDNTKILLLSRSAKLIGIYNLSAQGDFETFLDKRMIFVAACKANALSFIFARNYASNNIKPTDDDIYFYDQLFDAGEMMDIPLRDYLIYSPTTFFSFRENMAFKKIHESKGEYSLKPFTIDVQA